MNSKYNPLISHGFDKTRKQNIGWQDFADSATSEISPIIQSNVNGGEVLLTNNNGGTLTDGNTNINSETTIIGINDLWDTGSNTLVFKDTGIGKNDTILLRVELVINASIIDQGFDVRLDFYDDVDATGNKVFDIQKQIHNETISSGIFRKKSVDMKFFVGESILNGSGTISLVGTKSFEVNVIGWNITILKNS